MTAEPAAGGRSPNQDARRLWKAGEGSVGLLVEAALPAGPGVGLLAEGAPVGLLVLVLVSGRVVGLLAPAALVVPVVPVVPAAPVAVRGCFGSGEPSMITAFPCGR
ncbi:hypothetical protein ABIA35_004953 [Catenulispora sp. MAP12-49]|uniref:hypothetical protein n=1 Tax=Catenulispora sp. MAP12-49 TaxID=3156302 RepID=UPI0035118F31